MSRDNAHIRFQIQIMQKQQGKSSEKLLYIYLLINFQQIDQINIMDEQRLNSLSRQLIKPGKDLEQEEGFAEDEEFHPQIVVKQELLDTSQKIYKKTPKYASKEPKLKLTFMSIEKQQTMHLHSNKNQPKNDLHMKSLDMKKRNEKSSCDLSKYALNCVVKISRNFVGDNLNLINHSIEESKKIKFHIISSGVSMVYEFMRETSTYAHIGMIRERSIKKESEVNDGPQGGRFFLQKQANFLLKSKIKQSFIHPKRRQPSKQGEPIQFSGEFESANLQYACKVQQNEYQLFLRNDSNTHGHQNWFYFQIGNKTVLKRKVKLRIVNLKRNLNLIDNGQRIFTKKIGNHSSQWKHGGFNFKFNEGSNYNLYKGRVYILEFQIDLQAKTDYELSLLPPYTYSEMIDYTGFLQQNSPFVKVETLTFSLIGLAIPLLTFTDFSETEANKEVILISSRIHPGETVASHMIKGFMTSLTSGQPQMVQFLKNTIVKVVPMINPDGVVLGNFRTNFLGYDLNRSFQSDNEITNPEVVALKQLGRKLKNTYAEKFTTFLDMHGHSSQKNIFTYGPDVDISHEKFYKARLLPKLLNSKSPYFDYDSCTFKLQEYKVNTARGFFLNTLNINAYTVESSYAIYEGDEGKDCLLSIKQWNSFGHSLCESFQLMNRLTKTHSIKNRTQLKRALSMSKEEENNIAMMKNIKKEIKKQEGIRRKRKEKVRSGQEDSDGENEVEDLNPEEREQVEKKLVENSVRNVIFPRVFKPSVLYPTVTPKLFNIEDNTSSTYKILYTRRNRYHSIKMPANSYIHSLQSVDILKPNARNIKMEKRLNISSDKSLF